MAWAAGSSSAGAMVARTTNGGSTWDSHPITTDPDVHDSVTSVTFVSPNQGWAVSEDGFIFATNDGGITWSRLL
jgi:photosystem II stability/assembly factor-like uncharacterized protein